MNITDKHIGSVLKIKDIRKNSPCENCNTCVRLRIMELGMLEGDLIEIKDHQLGLWRIQILNEYGSPISTIALRDDEMCRIIADDSECSISFSY